MKEAGSFHKYIVVGHLPVSEYRKDICCFNPIIDTRRHIISIDGGNEVKSAGQLNALIYEQGRFQFACSDHLKKARITRDILPVNRTPFLSPGMKDRYICCVMKVHAAFAGMKPAAK